MSKPVSLREILPDLKTRDASSQSKAQAVLQLASRLQTDKDGAVRRELESYLEELAQDAQTLALAFAIMTTLFHIDRTCASEIFMKFSAQKSLSGSARVKDDVLEWMLDLFSAACADKVCRTEVESKYGDLVYETLYSPSSSQAAKALAACILIKLAATLKPRSAEEQEPEVDVEQLAGLLRKMVVANGHDAPTFSNALEGLTYATLNNSVKQKLINDAECLKVLLSVLTDKSAASAPPSLKYGVLTILSNLSSYPPILTKEGAQIKKLRSYANAGKAAADPDETRETIATRCKMLLDLNVIAALYACVGSASANAQLTIGSIMMALAMEKSHRALVVKQGGIAVILALTQPRAPDNSHNAPAASALAKVLISVNPALAFSSRNSPTLAVRPLLAQLESQAQGVTMLDEFEALLALTNLASMNVSEVPEAIVTHGWSKIENLMLADNPLVQRATIELVCNLVVHPSAAAKFLDKDDRGYKTRLRILVALTDAEDVKTRSAASGALAALSDWAPASEILMEDEKNVKSLLRVLEQEEDEGVIHRVAVCLSNVLAGANEKSSDFVRKFTQLGGIDAINKATLRTSRDSQPYDALLDLQYRLGST